MSEWNSSIAETGAPQCPYCAGHSLPFVASRDYNRNTTPSLFQYYQCSACGLIFMSPIPSDMGSFYAGGYDPIPPDLAGLRAIAEKERYRLDPILRYKTSGKLLEIGPWRGVFSLNAKDAGFDVSAIEMNQQCVDFLRQTVEIEAYQSNHPETTLSEMDDQFDVIALWHSLEHLPSPWKLVQAASHHLRPGGLLLIAIPNIESFEFQFLKDRWRHLDTPRHLFFYPIASLVELCRVNGLEELELETHDPLTELLARDTWRKWAHTVYPSRFVIEPLIPIMYRWARWRESKLRHAGSGLTAVFRRV